MTQEEIQEEVSKCIKSPYYFATKYVKVKSRKGETIPFTTSLYEKEFNKIFKKL